MHYRPRKTFAVFIAAAAAFLLFAGFTQAQQPLIRRVAVIWFRFANTPKGIPADRLTNVQAETNSIFNDRQLVSLFLRETRNKITFGGLTSGGPADAFGWVNADYSYNAATCDVTAIRSSVQRALAKDLSAYDTIIYIPSYWHPKCGFQGLAEIPATVAPRTKNWVYYQYFPSNPNIVIEIDGSFAHEMAHGFGLSHSGALINCANGLPGPTCQIAEYGSKYDIMGSGRGRISGYHILQAGWVDSAKTLVNAEKGTVFAPLRGLENPQPLMARIPLAGDAGVPGDGGVYDNYIVTLQEDPDAPGNGVILVTLTRKIREGGRIFLVTALKTQGAVFEDRARDVRITVNGALTRYSAGTPVNITINRFAANIPAKDGVATIPLVSSVVEENHWPPAAAAPQPAAPKAVAAPKPAAAPAPANVPASAPTVAPTASAPSGPQRLCAPPGAYRRLMKMRSK